jgi:hypothetical protein
VNIYDNYYDLSAPGSQTPAGVRFNAYMNWTPAQGDGPGLIWMRNFANSRGKPLVLGEWGAGWQPPYNGGDAPYFIDAIHSFIADPNNNVAYANWWDGSRSWQYKLDALPLMKQEMQTVFGGP